MQGMVSVQVLGGRVGGLLHACLVFFEGGHKSSIEMPVLGEHLAKWNDKVIMVAIT